MHTKGGDEKTKAETLVGTGVADGDRAKPNLSKMLPACGRCNITQVSSFRSPPSSELQNSRTDDVFVSEQILHHVLVGGGVQVEDG